MPLTGHFKRLRPVIAGLSRRGFAMNVYTHRQFAPEVVRAGGKFHDLFGQYPLEDADATSLPVPCRYVTHAAKFADSIARDVAATKPSLVIHDLFAVIARVVATSLGIPRVNVCSGHNLDPQRFTAILHRDPRVRLAPECLRAADILRDSYGIADASPFCYVSTLSPLLNLYCEPPEFLQEDERHPFAPLAFFGSLPSPDDADAGEREDPPKSVRKDREIEAFVSFGTVIWRYYTADALRALTTLTSAFARMDNVRVTVSLGRASIDAQQIAALAHANVRIEPYVDQWRLLQRTDLLITHHGLNSTHEAIFHGVPMISYPFFWDQPALAARCWSFGLAVPLVTEPRGFFAEVDVHRALNELAAGRETMQSALVRAREWELAVMATRPAALQQMVDLMA